VPPFIDAVRAARNADPRAATGRSPPALPARSELEEQHGQTEACETADAKRDLKRTRSSARANIAKAEADLDAALSGLR
jgi:hypothetical protein